MPVKINGLPAHILLIHAVIVLLPLGALMLVASAVWPAARRKLGFLTPAVSLIALILVPVTTNAGEWLRDRLPQNPAIQKHADLGDTLLPWAAGIFVVAAALWLLGRRFELTWRPDSTAPDPDEPAATTGSTGSVGTATLTQTRPAPTKLPALPVWVAAVVAVIALAVSAGGVVQLYRIGDSGSKAVWGGIAEQPARGGGGS
ncbi:MAG: hypothetical protein QOJ37_3834 [Pseudonocardiales bacterium]|nr:hypothetical protein [Pseudonocardiales bacterium]